MRRCEQPDLEMVFQNITINVSNTFYAPYHHVYYKFRAVRRKCHTCLGELTPVATAIGSDLISRLTTAID